MKHSTLFLIMVMVLSVCQSFATDERIKTILSLVSVAYFGLFFISLKQETKE